jgi:acetolactate synthase-1/2/3 large subunit
VVKAAWAVEDAARLGEEVATALALAASGRPGPVNLSLPGDLLDARVQSPAPAAPRAVAAAGSADAALLGRVLDWVAAASRPLLLLSPAMGRGRRREAAEGLGEAVGAPALLMESPRGVSDPALRGTGPCLARADRVLLLGKDLDFSLRFGEPPALAEGARFARIAWAPPLAAGAGRLDLSLVADPVDAAERLLRLARERRWPRSAWPEEVARGLRLPDEWEALRRSPAVPIHPMRVAAEIQPLLDRGSVLVSDGGEFGQWMQAGLQARERLINGPSGSIGSAIPVALGARLARPERPVIATVGDGTFGFHAFELDTAVRHRLPVVVVVGNDARWNAEHQLQLQHYGADRAHGCTLLPTRYDRLAQALGAHGEHVERPEELGPALARALASGLPACVNVAIEGAAAPAPKR